MKSLVIVGAGGFAREVLWVAQSLADEWKVIGFLDDSDLSEVDGFPVLGGVDEVCRYQDSYFTVGIGNPRLRRSVVNRINQLSNAKFATLVHPSAQIGHKVGLGEGTIVTAGCIITTNVSIGSHNHLNLNTTVGHDVITGDYCTFAPLVAVSGNVYVESGVEVGTGAAIRQGIRLYEGSTVGMSACVVKDVQKNAIFAGNPAKLLKMNADKWSAGK